MVCVPPCGQLIPGELGLTCSPNLRFALILSRSPQAQLFLTAPAFHYINSKEINAFDAVDIVVRKQDSRNLYV